MVYKTRLTTLGLVMQKLLCVDDEQFILSALHRLFKSQYDVRIASSGSEALRMLSAEPVDVVISDQRMPGMTGVELFKQVRELAPNTMRILLTGYADLPATIEAVNSGEVFRYVTKPWSNDSLRMTVALAMRAALRTAPVLGTPVLAGGGSGADGARSGAAAAATSTVQALVGPEVQVLVLDRDPSLASLTRELLADERQCHAASSLEQAADLLETHGEIGVLVTEARVGSDDLVHVLASLRSVRPGLCTIVASRLADAQLVIRLINQGQIYRYIGKPVNPDKLRNELNGALRRHVQLRGAPTLHDRHVGEVVKPVQESIEQNHRSGGGLRALFARVAGLFR